MNLKTTSFVFPIANDCRMRHLHRRQGKRVVSFVVQLEVRHPIRGVWLPVVRYDTGHGFAHRDRLHADRTVEKTPLPIQDYAETLNYAEADLKDHWQFYRDRFLEELKHEK